MSRVVCIAALVLVATAAIPTAQQSEAPVFKSGVERVTVAAVVRDSKGKLVTNLRAQDFELLDSGRRRPLIDVWSEPSPASIAILVDASGSMATKMDLAREAAQSVVAGLRPSIDEVALFSFDTELKELRPFSTHTDNTQHAWSTTRPFGATSLWDVIAQTAREISERERRRALVVITDGVDSASKLKPDEVSAIASSVDVPVYMLVVTFLEDTGGDPQPLQGPLADLAIWTGGDSAVIRDALGAATAARHILTELQYQYVIAFEPSSIPGWHPLSIKTRKNGLTVRARSGYTVGEKFHKLGR